VGSQDIAIRAGLLLLHAAIIVYVTLGWATTSRIGLLTYALVVPLIMLQWLVNGGSSIVTNFEILARTGHWSDSSGHLEGTLFQRALGGLGIPATVPQVNAVVVMAMFFLWTTAMYRMILTAPSLPAN
jgi:hypothetical protein